MDVTNTRAALPTPRIPLAFDGALSYDDVVGTTELNVIVEVGPWTDFRDGDTLEILWSATAEVVATYSASLVDANTIVKVPVPTRIIKRIADATAPGTYTVDVVARVSNILGPPIDSLPASILVKLTVPGGVDVTPTPPDVNENLPLAVVVPSTIAPVTPSATVEIKFYENRAAGDAITVRWNTAGNDVRYGPLTQAEATGTASIFVPIGRNIIDAGGVGDALKITYQIYDVVNNWSLWSLPASVAVTDPNSFPAPEVPEAVGGSLPGDAPGATLRVPASAGLQTGDSVTAYFGISTLGTKPAIGGVALDFPISAALIQANQGQTVACQYTVLRNGTSTPSDSLALIIETAPPSEWDEEYNFDQDGVRYVNPGGFLYFPEARGTMNVQFDPDTAHAPAERLGVEAYPFTAGGEFAGNDLYIGYPPGIENKNTVFINFDQSWDRVRFAVTSASREVTISFKDADLNVLGSIHRIDPGDVQRQTLIVHDDGGLGRIRHAEIRSLEVIRLDSFKFRLKR